MTHTTRYTIIGAGNGGRAMAGHLALMDFPVVLYNQEVLHATARQRRRNRPRLRRALRRELGLLAFGLVTAGVTASFFLHFCDFARTHARALEGRINALLGRRVLIASELEADYFYPHEATKISGFVPERPDSFFSFFTLHFTVVWGASIVAALASLRALLDGWSYLALLVVFTAWTAANAAFLLRWFGGAAERRMAEKLRKTYDPDRAEA